ncbi:hypothetical protein [Pantoea agglomerans]
MSLDIAYSIEIEDFIDPDRAYELYWAGAITNKKAFICPGENCNVRVTCANLDKESHDMKVVPHFRLYGDHNEQCEIFRKVPLKIIEEINRSQESERKSIDLSVVDIFNLKRPDSYYDINDIKGGKDNAKDIKVNSPAIKNVSYNLKQTGSIGSVYSVRTIVSRYLRYFSDGSLNNRVINIKGINIPYVSFLKLIWEQKITDLPQHELVYYGWAYIDKHEKGYRIKFKKSFLNDRGELLPVSFFISYKTIENYPIKKLVMKRIASISSMMKPIGFVYVYGKPKIYTSPHNCRQYINFDVFNLDLVDLNKDSPMPKKGNVK